MTTTSTIRTSATPPPCPTRRRTCPSASPRTRPRTAPPAARRRLRYSWAAIDITITQGDGPASSAVVTYSTAYTGCHQHPARLGRRRLRRGLLLVRLGGDVSITQGDGAGDTALVDETFSAGSILVTQGAGDGDTATVSCSTAVVDINVTQGDGNGDTVYILGVVGRVCRRQWRVPGRCGRHRDCHPGQRLCRLRDRQFVRR